MRRNNPVRGKDESRVDERDARTLQTNRPAIVAAMAKYAYASAWADAYEEAGGKFGPGQEIMDIAPPPTPEAKKWAEKTAKDIERMNDASLDELIRKAMEADGTPGKEGDWVGEFAYGIAMFSLGHGVSWFDDHKDFPLELPHNDFIVYSDEPEVVAALEKDKGEIGEQDAPPGATSIFDLGKRPRDPEMAAKGGDPKRIAKIRKIVDDSQAARVDGQMVDGYTASAIIKIYDKLNPANQEKYAVLPVKQMAAVAWKMIGGGRNEGLEAAYEDARRESPQLFSGVEQG